MEPRPQTNPTDALKRAVLVSVLHAHPKALTVEELRQEFGGAVASEAAVDALESVGLVRRDRGGIGPTVAAVEMDRLLGPTV